MLSFRPLAWTALSLSILAASAAAAPDPSQCTVPPVIVGDSNGMQIGPTGYRVVVRDAFGDPVPLSHVQIVFGGSVKAYTSQPAPVTTICPIIARNATTVGIAVFVPRIGGFSNSNTVQVIADNVTIGFVKARSTDLNASGATDPFDFNAFRLNFLNNPAAQETDYDQDGTTTPFDFNIFRQVFLADVPGTTCP